ncbi:MAG: hypothetical protein K6U89_06605 [Chloroflexi bacterium]|nr:hypothetical protein [Chloroflexota bacterium]
MRLNRSELRFVPTPPTSASSPVPLRRPRAGWLGVLAAALALASLIIAWIALSGPQGIDLSPLSTGTDAEGKDVRLLLALSVMLLGAAPVVLLVALEDGRDRSWRLTGRTTGRFQVVAPPPSPTPSQWRLKLSQLIGYRPAAPAAAPATMTWATRTGQWRRVPATGRWTAAALQPISPQARQFGYQRAYPRRFASTTGSWRLATGPTSGSWQAAPPGTHPPGSARSGNR